MDNDNPGAVAETTPQETQKKPSQTHVGRDATLLTFSKVVTAGIAMLMTMILSRMRTKAEYGTYNQILMVVNLMTAILMLGLPKSLNYFLARADTKEEKQRFLSFYYTLNTILSFIVGAVLCVSVWFIEKYFKNYEIHKFLYFLALFPWTKIISSSIENLLIVYKKPKSLVVFRVMNSVALLGAVLVIWACDGWIKRTFHVTSSFTAYMILYLAVEIAFSVAVYIIAAKVSGGLRFYISKKMVRTVMAFSIPLGLAQVVGTLNVELDRLLIGKIVDTENFAIYSNAAKELPVTLIASSFTAVLLPQMVRMLKKDRNEDALRLWGNATTLSLIIIAIIGTGCFVFAEDAIEILYGEKYLPGAWVFRMYALHLLMRVTYYGMVLNSIGKTRFIFWCSIGALSSNAVLNVLFYLAFKFIPGLAFLNKLMLAPAIATLVSTTFMAAIQLKVTAKCLNVRFSRVLPWAETAKILLINVGFGALFFWIKRLLPLEKYLTFSFDLLGKRRYFNGSMAESLILGAVWAVVYFAVMMPTIKKKWRELKVKES